MRVPLTWMAQYIPLRADGSSAVEVAADLVQVGLEEEGIHSSDITGPVVVGRVMEVVSEPQKNGKTINWCQVDVGVDHATDSGGPRGIVCGAHNFMVGDLVVAALPGAVLSGGFGISSRKTYGHVSDGMICSAMELGLGEDHDGIIVLGRYLGEAEAARLVPGQDVLPVLGLDEQTVEVNVTPDRGYCFSVRGVAREYASATGRPDQFQDPAAAEAAAPTPNGFAVEVMDDAPIHGIAGCSRFVTRIVHGIDPQRPSPAWLRRRLEQVGVRSISLVVDVTNYVMMGLGQPMHGYDLAKVTGPITVRRARGQERLVTLDGVDRVLHPEDLLITDARDGQNGSRIIGLAGVMGGSDTEISASTVDVLLEAAHFDAVSIARTARRHRLPSEASKRFERGVDPALQAVAAQLAVDLLVEHGGGAVDPAVGDYDHRPQRQAIAMSATEPSRLVGVDFTVGTVLNRLREIGCEVDQAGNTLTATPPSWRPDLLQAADLVEEVARLEGYDKIPSVLPIAPAGTGLTAKQRLRRSVTRGLADRGWDEVLSYPFVGVGLFDAFGYQAADPHRSAIRLANPLSEEAPLLRTSVLQTLVEVLRRNLSRGSTDLALVEIGSVTTPGSEEGTNRAPLLSVGSRPSAADLARLVQSVPDQPLMVAGIACGQALVHGWWGQGRSFDAADAIDAARFVLERAGAAVQVTSTVMPPWHPGRCAVLCVAGEVVAHAGELHPRVLESLGLPARTVAFEVDFDALVALTPEALPARPVSPHQVVKEDVALIVDDSVPSQTVAAALREGGGTLLESARVFDVYVGPQVGEGKKSLAFALRMRAPDRTLRAEETTRVRQEAVAAAVAAVGAELRGV